VLCTRYAELTLTYHILQSHRSFFQICTQELDKKKPEKTIEDLIASSQEQIDEMLADGGPSLFQYMTVPGHNMAFYDYPLAQAYRSDSLLRNVRVKGSFVCSLLGWAHRKLARRIAQQEAPKAKLPSIQFLEAIRKSAEYYDKAAETSPVDDENRYGMIDLPSFSHSDIAIAVYLRFAMSGYCRSGTPLSILLPILEDYVAGVPQMKRIWENSSLGTHKGMQTQLEDWIVWHQFVKGELKKGKVKESDMVMPAWEQRGSDL
jgi:hypothetical protein